MAMIKGTFLSRVAGGWDVMGSYATKTGGKIVTLAKARTKSEASAKKRKLDAKIPFNLSMAKSDIEFYWQNSPLMRIKRKRRSYW